MLCQGPFSSISAYGWLGGLQMDTLLENIFNAVFMTCNVDFKLNYN